MHTKQIYVMYKALLADVSRLTGVTLTPPSIDDEWITISGPKLDKQILRWIEAGGEPPLVPEWLIPLWDLFLSNKDAVVYRHLRTLLNFGYKIEYAPTPQQIEEAERQFLDVERGIEIWDGSHEPAQDPFFRRVRVLIHKVLKRATMDKFQSATPFHGPGAVYPRQEPWTKSRFSTEYKSITRYYPWDTWFQGIFVEDLLDDVSRNDSPSSDIVCSMVAVPKDSRGPRLICVHPAEAIWIQQSQRTVIERVISSHPVAGWFIHFDDQTVNGELALLNSKCGTLATLDLKEASDRLSKKLVDYLLGDHADILGCSRATHVRLLSGRVVQLRKWAPMGNCLTFPVESLIFWAIAHTAMERCSSDKCIPRTVVNGPGGTDLGLHCCYVFGDDLIIPSIEYNRVIVRLVQAGLVPNPDKCFYRGLFRESCGVDAYNGVDVTPIRTKVGEVDSYSSAESLCSLARRCQERDYSALAACIYDNVQAWLLQKTHHDWRNNRFTEMMPISNNPKTQGIYRYVPIKRAELIVLLATRKDAHKYIRYNEKRQYFETRYIRLVPRKRRPRDSRWNLVDSLVNLERGGPSDRGLEYVVPNCNRSQFGWTYIED